MSTTFKLFMVLLTACGTLVGIFGGAGALYAALFAWMGGLFSLSVLYDLTQEGSYDKDS